MPLAVGSNKTINNSYYADGRVYAGRPCKIGVNAQKATDWAMPNMYNNCVKQGQSWFDLPPGTVTDADGWIVSMTGAAALYVMHGIAPEYGEYTVTYDGTASFMFNNNINHATQVGTNKYTYTLTAENTIDFQIMLRFENGSVSNVKCYLTSDEPAVNAGLIFRQEYIDDMMSSGVIRFMDMQGTNNSFMRNVSDVSTVDSVTWKHNMPPEAIAELCNRTNSEAWICIPHQATDALVTDFMQRLDTNLTGSPKVWVEYSNETWHSTYAFHDQFAFTSQHGQTVFEATCQTNIFTQTAHNLSTNDVLVAFNTERTIIANSPTNGATVIVTVLTPDTFSVESYDFSGDIRTPAITPDNFLMRYTLRNADDSYATQRANHALASLHVWVLADSVITRARCVHVIATQLAGADSSTQVFFSNPDIVASADYLAVAPYTQYNLISHVDPLNVTDIEIKAKMLSDIPIIAERLISNMQYSTAPIICYEGSEEILFSQYGNADEFTRALAWATSVSAGEVLGALGTELAKYHVELVAWFHSHEGTFGIRQYIGDTSSSKYTATKDDYAKGYINRGSN